MRRRIFARGGERQVPRIDVTNLIDIIMILLIFSIVSATFVRESTVAIQRPESRQAAPLSASYVAVALLRSGAVALGDQVLTLDSLPAALSQALRQAGCTRVVVQADREAPVGLLLKVMDGAKSAGAQSVEVAAERGP